MLYVGDLNNFQLLRVHRDPHAPRGHPHRQRHPGDALLAEEDDADDVHEDSAGLHLSKHLN